MTLATDRRALGSASLEAVALWLSGSGLRPVSAPVSAALSETRAGSTVVRLARGLPRKVVLGSPRSYEGSPRKCESPRNYGSPRTSLDLFFHGIAPGFHRI